MPPPKAAVKGRPQGDRRARAACCQGARRLALDGGRRRWQFGEAVEPVCGAVVGRKLFRVDRYWDTLVEVNHLVGLAEIAEMLGVSRQRAGQLSREYPDFPAPVAELASGRVWERAGVEEWALRHPQRRPGRPALRTEAFRTTEDIMPPADLPPPGRGRKGGR